MTMPSPPAVSSGDFGGILVPPDIQRRIISTLIEQAAFANSITRLPTSAGEVAFPVAAPSGAAWVAELAQIPLMSLNDRADAGGTATTIAASGATLAAADNQRDDTGAPMFPAGFGAACGLIPVTVPGLDPPLVYDASRLYLVVRDDSSVEVSDQFRWDFDATTFRVRARMAVACPDPNKGIRALTITPPGTTQIVAKKGS